MTFRPSLLPPPAAGPGLGAALLLPAAARADLHRRVAHDTSMRAVPLIMLTLGNGGKEPWRDRRFRHVRKQVAFATAEELARSLRSADVTA